GQRGRADQERGDRLELAGDGHRLDQIAAPHLGPVARRAARAPGARRPAPEEAQGEGERQGEPDGAPRAGIADHPGASARSAERGRSRAPASRPEATRQSSGSQGPRRTGVSLPAARRARGGETERSRPARGARSPFRGAAQTSTRTDIPGRIRSGSAPESATWTAKAR